MNHVFSAPAVALILAIILSGCSSSTGRASPPRSAALAQSTTGASSAVTPTTASPGIAECTTSQISVAFVSTQGAGGATGLAEFSIMGLTAAGCRTTGYPGVQLFNGGQPLPTQAAHGAGTLTHAGSPETVALSVTGTGFFTIEYQRVPSAGESCPIVTSIGVIPPNQGDAIAVPTPTTGVPFTPCDGAVTVTPIQAGSPPSP